MLAAMPSALGLQLHMDRPSTPIAGDNLGMDVIVSGDGNRIQFDKFKVMSSSAVLRGMLTRMPESVPLLLPEAGIDLLHFISLLQAGPTLLASEQDLEPFPSAPTVLDRLPAVQLLRKYDCTKALQYTLTTLKCHLMEGTVCPLQAFMLGSLLEDMDVCRTAILHADTAVNSDEEGAALIKHYWDTVPDNYRRALQTCFSKFSDPRERGNYFVQLMSTYEDDHDLAYSMSH